MTWAKLDRIINYEFNNELQKTKLFNKLKKEIKIENVSILQFKNIYENLLAQYPNKNNKINFKSNNIKNECLLYKNDKREHIREFCKYVICGKSFCLKDSKNYVFLTKDLNEMKEKMDRWRLLDEDFSSTISIVKLKIT